VALPRISKRQTYRPNYYQPDSDPESYFRIAVYIPFLDSFIMQLKSRFTKHKDVLSGFQAIFPNNTDDTEVMQSFRNTCEYYGDDLSNTISDIMTELGMWRDKMIDANPRPSCAISAMKICNSEIYPNIYCLLEILATLPVSTATPERSFSSLKRIKTYLRNSIGQVKGG
jgi:hypothetical protein